MPATEQTWRSPKLMHIIFAATSLAMLVSTIWMFAKDHTREWKDYQKAHNAVNQFYAQGREDEAQSLQYALELEKATADVQEAEKLPVESDEVAKFKKLVEDEAARLEIKPYDFSKVEANLQATGGDGDATNAASRRTAIVSELREAIAEAKHREDTLLQKRKFAAADFTAMLSLRDLAVHEGRSQEEIDKRQAIVKAANTKVEALSKEYQAASLHRKALEAIVVEITAPVEDAKANLTKVQADVKRYQDSIESLGKKIGRKILSMPIVDAFDNSDLTIDQIWLPTLTINYNFSNVARFDRCITCHRANETSQPGAPTEPAYGLLQPPRTVMLSTPSEMPVREKENAEEKQADAIDGGDGLSDDAWVLREAYGLLLSSTGVLNPNDVTIQVVWPKVGDAPARAAEAGLQMGDVILSIGGSPVLNSQDAMARLVGEVTWGQPVEMTIQRGLPHPFASHPRLDLYCGSTSPHKQGEMGCTICHDGQGSATAFKWASHTPNNPTIAAEWAQEHGWFDNHHWIFPMYPKRFAESGCLKCHHEVVELHASERFPDPPAPKLMDGYELVRQYGCFGCHEINGYDGPSKRIGPDMRTEPNFYALAQTILLDPNLTPEESSWAAELVHHPERDEPRHRLYEAIQLDKKLRLETPAKAEAAAEKEADEDAPQELAARFLPTTYRMGDQLKDVESPGTLRKPGPSLRYLGSKSDASFVYDWVRKPSSFRPTTKMPQFFGLWDHLSKEEQEETAPLEAIEIRAITKYLLDSSQTFEYATPPESVTADPSVGRGMHLFQTRGCLACHSHEDFPGINNHQGPDLSLTAVKFGNETGKKWLYTWLRDPSQYHVRTKMPNLFLEPITSADGTVSDPIADMVEFLTTSGPGFDVSVSDGAVSVSNLNSGFPAADKLAVDDVIVAIGAGQEGMLESLEGKTADEVVALLRGAPGSSLRLEVKKAGAEEDAQPVTVEVSRVGYSPEPLPGEPMTAEKSNSSTNFDVDNLSDEEQKALYDLALQSLQKAYPPPVAKRYLEEGILDIEPSTMKGDDVVLAGEINESNKTEKYLLYVGRRAISKYGCSGCHDIPGYEDAKPIGTGLADWGRKDPSRLAFEQISQFLPLHGGDHAATHAAHSGPLPPYELTPEQVADPDTQFYFEAIAHHNRQGFIWQKLRQPRSYDYEKVENKEYNDRLRMPKFPFDTKEREAVITFILGLVAEPPAPKYIYSPNPRQEAIVKGRKVLEEFNCAGCHTMKMAQWDFALAGDDENFEAPPIKPNYPFLATHATPEELAKSLKTDKRGLRHASVHGRPEVSEFTGQPLLYNEELEAIEPGEEGEAKEIYYSFELWRDAVVNGHIFPVGGATLKIKDSASTKYPAWGGDLANYLHPVVVKDETAINPDAKGIGKSAWGWVPPPLVGEGAKVQTAWLHDFLLDPTPIRPAVVLRMPKFNMSPDDASALANYFAAVDNVEYPYEFDSRTNSNTISEMETADPGRLQNAFGIVANAKFCASCHKIGDYAPTGSEKAMGPNLVSVYERLRPEYARRWIAAPTQILPYTGMPPMIPYEPTPPHYGGVPQDLFTGTSFEQLNGVVDLLMNFDMYTIRSVSIKPQVKQPPPEGEAQPPAGQENAAATGTENGATPESPEPNPTTPESAAGSPKSQPASPETEPTNNQEKTTPSTPPNEPIDNSGAE